LQVRAGVSVSINITAHDMYGNKLTSGGETTWSLILKTFPPDFLGQTSVGSITDQSNGIYIGEYTPVFNGVMLLQVFILVSFLFHLVPFLFHFVSIFFPFSSILFHFCLIFLSFLFHFSFVFCFVFVSCLFRFVSFGSHPQVTRGTPVPVNMFKYTDASSLEMQERPGANIWKGTGGGAYADQDLVFDFVPPSGFEGDELYVGVLVNILPGPLSAVYTQMTTSDIIKGSGSCTLTGATTAERGNYKTTV
jgi:hypothetical protein